MVTQIAAIKSMQHNTQFEPKKALGLEGRLPDIIPIIGPNISTRGRIHGFWLVRLRLSAPTRVIERFRMPFPQIKRQKRVWLRPRPSRVGLDGVREYRLISIRRHYRLQITVIEG
jgi:hypothetical protein